MRTFVFITLSLIYPFMVYFALGRVPIWQIASMLVFFSVLRAIGSKEQYWWSIAAVSLALAVTAGLSANAIALKFYPVVISLSLLFVFGSSLSTPMSVVERIARSRGEQLSLSAQKYCRNVTKMWCVFFVFNAATAAVLAYFFDDRAWALYCGLISYILMGAIFSIEFLVRMRVKANHKNE